MTGLDHSNSSSKDCFLPQSEKDTPRRNKAIRAVSSTSPSAAERGERGERGRGSRRTRSHRRASPPPHAKAESRPQCSSSPRRDRRHVPCVDAREEGPAASPELSSLSKGDLLCKYMDKIGHAHSLERQVSSLTQRNRSLEVQLEESRREIAKLKGQTVKAVDVEDIDYDEPIRPYSGRGPSLKNIAKLAASIRNPVFGRASSHSHSTADESESESNNLFTIAPRNKSDHIDLDDGTAFLFSSRRTESLRQLALDAHRHKSNAARRRTCHT